MNPHKKKELLKKINDSDFLSNEDKTALIDLLSQKRYGLVWEDKPENAEEILKETLPLLTEVQSRAIISGNSEAIPSHILIEGDNLHALTTLCFTHEGKIDVIYIDPPYNTGKRNEFRYNDNWIDLNSPFRHSMWLSFIYKRLQIAKRLLSENSAIFISIDNNEFAQLKMLCDEIFLEQNFFGSLIWRKKEGGGQTDAYFVTEHEYILCYKKGDFKWLDDTEEGSISQYNREDDKGKFKLVKLEKWGSGARKEDRPTMHFALISPDGNEFFPTAPDGNPGRYRVGQATMKEIIKENKLHWEKKNRWIPYEKVYFNPEKNKTIKARSILYKLANTGDGTNELTDIFNKKDIFENPKPSELVKFILSHSCNTNSIILDFFAGSGTTLQATMALNAEDGKTRQCILVTNNENDIAEKVCYERNKRVIEGYSKPNGEKVEGLQNNNLRYYKTEFISREKTLANKKQLTALATDLLCIKENCYSEITRQQKLKPSEIRIFSDDGKIFMVIYDDVFIPQAIEIIKKLPNEITCKVYVFSDGRDPYTDDFEEVLHKVELCALPDAIYKAYYNILPKAKKLTPVLEEAL